MQSCGGLQVLWEPLQGQVPQFFGHTQATNYLLTLRPYLWLEIPIKGKTPKPKPIMSLTKTIGTLTACVSLMIDGFGVHTTYTRGLGSFFMPCTGLGFNNRYSTDRHTCAYSGVLATLLQTLRESRLQAPAKNTYA